MQMIQYNVAGGKMNRGLTVLDVQQTFARVQGRPLSNKVRKLRALFLTLFLKPEDDALSQITFFYLYPRTINYSYLLICIRILLDK